MAEPDFQEQMLTRDSVGARLRHAREALGLSLGDVCARTKIAERHLAAIQEDRFADLASRTYAVGFARAYARAVGLDEAEIAEAVRAALADGDADAVPQVAAFEPGDPARVPGARVAWLSALAAVAVVGLIVVFWRSYVSPAASLPQLTADLAEPTAGAEPSPSPPPAPGQAGPVVFTALAPDVWVKFYDAAGNQLMQKQMAQGESYTVPADANAPLLRTARPDALRITVGGKPVPPLAADAVVLRDVPVSAGALLARANPAPSSSAAPPPTGPSQAPRAGAVDRVVTASPRPSATAAPATPVSRDPAEGARPSTAPSAAPSPEAAPAATPTPVEGSAESSTVSG